MKVIVFLMCTVASTTASNAISWPGAIPLSSTHVKTILPSQINSFGYSTSQYINAVPPPKAHQPQLNYQIALPGYHPYQPVFSASYFPSNSFLYPSYAPIVPAAPGVSAQPPQTIPSRPAEQPAGDEDTAVVDSAVFTSGQQQPIEEKPQSQQPSNQSTPPQPSLDSKNMPAIPQIPQFPGQIPQLPVQIPQFPGQFPQIPSQIPQLPSLPQFPSIGSNFPQIPQLPQLPMNPLFPQSPSSSSSFPSAFSDQGLNDEDSVSVDAV